MRGKIDTIDELIRLKLTIAYDGRICLGWQRQRDEKGVQNVLEDVLTHLVFPSKKKSSSTEEVVKVHGAGRTDAGVHAFGQVAHFDVPESRWRRIPPDQWLCAINAHLPPEIKICKMEVVPREFHARFSATGKHYRYRLWNSRFLHPLEIGRAWLVPGELDAKRFAQALDAMVGKHDFSFFSTQRGKGSKQPVSTVRTIRRAELTRDEEFKELWICDFEGNGFLYRMARLMVGTAIRCAQGRTEIAEIREWLKPKKEDAAERVQKAKHRRLVADAEGLYLVNVEYD